MRRRAGITTFSLTERARLFLVTGCVFFAVAAWDWRYLLRTMHHDSYDLLHLLVVCLWAARVWDDD